MTDLDDLLIGIDPFDLLESEQHRLLAHFQGLGEDDWLLPSRCEGWRVRDVLAHLAASEEYNRACLEDDLDAFRADHADQVGSLGELNDRGVRERADRPVEAILGEWQAGSQATRQGLRRLGREGTLRTSAGPYPAHYQAVHLAVEAATHGDDVGVEVADDERASRTRWRAEAARFGLAEAGMPATVHASGANDVVVGTECVSLSDEELVDATTGRLGGEAVPSSENLERLRIFA